MICRVEHLSTSHLYIFFVPLDVTYQDHEDFKREIRENIEGNFTCTKTALAKTNVRFSLTIIMHVL